ncbi:prolyl 4-hydroxylase subunit alpha-2 [Caerostris extrusa]|uniref:Prolyl 4-hydroxylase subunit alpha-2 n=1 Tax=Caerostris extrusa TaxID=172846 RepID=A0AAV4TDH0_CAEEX|nr:prolyl 4-hydroxylase subunit alpha-2 [Caerostris extrusa]
MLVVLFVLINLICLLVKGELYSALAGMEALLDTQRLRNDLVHLQNGSKGNFSGFRMNPINAFVLIKKLTVDWDDARIIMSCKRMTEAIKIVLNFRSDCGPRDFPDQEDLSGAAKALLRVQQTYSLEKQKPFLEGKILGAPNGFAIIW